MAEKRLAKGDEVMVYWKPSYYRGDALPTKATYIGKSKEDEYMLKTNRGVHHTKDRSMFRVITKRVEVEPYENTLFPATTGNAITKEYYYFLKGELNRGTIKNKSVSRIVNKGGRVSYHLTSTYGGL